jgi:glycosyltransferase involved in cell wall biosynthesis
MPLKSKSKFSLILPVFNEEKIVKKSIDQLIKLQLENEDIFEIIIVNDGSSDETHEILKKFIQNDNLKIIDLSKNYGYGRALKTGISHSTYDTIFITDIDGTYPNDRIVEFFF